MFEKALTSHCAHSIALICRKVCIRINALNHHLAAATLFKGFYVRALFNACFVRH